jgi:glucosamine 6-phosphate synthetase-like amidotransferase/phosphosugar isomerase protein
MCEILACHGSGEAIELPLTGLGKLEYRCHDSVGVSLAGRLGRDVDKPRNLGKSVMVE